MKTKHIHPSPKFLTLGLLAALTLLFSFPSESKAAITLTIDSDVKTVSLSGSDSGDPFDAGGSGLFSSFRWVLGSDNTGVTAFSVASGVDFSNFAPLDPLGSLFSANLSVAEGEVVLGFTLRTDVTSVAFSGNGTPVSYATLPASNQTYLESLTSSNPLPLVTGTGASAVQINAIPEPSSAALTLAALALGYGLLRRRRVVNS